MVKPLLPGTIQQPKKGFLSDVVEGLAAIINPFGYAPLKNQETAFYRQNFDEQMEYKRQAYDAEKTKAQLQMQCYGIESQQQIAADNRAMQQQEGNLNRVTQMEQGQLNRQHVSEEKQKDRQYSSMLEEQRQRFREKELVLQEFQRQDNLLAQSKENHQSRQLQRELAQMNDQRTTFEQDQNRQLQTWLTLFNKEAAALEGLLSRELQRDLQTLNHHFQAAENQLNRDHALQLQTFRANVDQWLWQQQREWQREAKWIDAELAREIREIDKQNRLKEFREQKRLNHLPVCLLAEEILQANQQTDEPPLRIFYSPPHLSHDASKHQFENVFQDFQALPLLRHVLSENQLKRPLRKFIEEYRHNNRPVEFIDGAWLSKAHYGEAAVKAMFSELKTEPTLILELSLSAFDLDLHTAFWGQNPDYYRYQHVHTLPLVETLNELAKDRTYHWWARQQAAKRTDEAHLTAYYGEAQVKQYQMNRLTLQREQQAIEDGEDLFDIPKQYGLNERDYQRLSEFLSIVQCLHIGMVADEYFLIGVAYENHRKPLLPLLLETLLKSLNQDEKQPLIAIIVGFYQGLYAALSQEVSAWGAELYLELAHSLAFLEDKHWAEQQLLISLNAWLNYRGAITEEAQLDDALEKVPQFVQLDDQAYLEALFTCLQALERHEQADQLTILQHIGAARQALQQGLVSIEQKLLEVAMSYFQQAISHYPDFAEAHYHLAEVYVALQQPQAALKHYDQALRINPYYFRAYYDRGRTHAALGNLTQQQTDWQWLLEIEAKTVDAFLARGSVYREQGQFAAALNDFDQAVHLEPNHFDALFCRGHIHFWQKNFVSAVEDLQQAMSIKPHSESAFKLLTQTRHQLAATKR